MAETISHGWWLDDEKLKAFEALVRADEREQALAAPVQEPIGYFTVNDYDNWEQIDGTSGKPLYERPAAQPAPVQQERELLRTAQSEAVMPLIGPLLDAWEGGSDFLNEYPALDKQLRRIHRAMEHSQPAAPVQPVQEPVAWPMEEQPDGSIIPVDPSELPSDYFTTPPAQRQWVGLTDEEIAKLDCYDHLKFARAIEAKLKEKNA